MPDYTITDNKTGRSLTVRGSSPPTDAEAEELFARSAPVTPTKSSWGDATADLAIGLGKSAGDTIVGAGNLVHKIPGVSRFSDWAWGLPSGGSQQAMAEATTAMQPTNPTQSMSKFAGDMAQAAVLPMGKGKFVARALTNAAGGAGYEAVKGGNPVAGGVAGAVVPEAIQGGVKAAKWLGNKLVLHAISPNIASEVGHISESSVAPAHEVRQQMADTFINRDLNVTDAGTDKLRNLIREQHATTEGLVKGLSDEGKTVAGKPILRATAQRSIPWARNQADPTAEVLAVKSKLRHLAGADTPTNAGRTPTMMPEPNPALTTPIEQWRMQTKPGDVVAEGVSYHPNLPPPQFSPGTGTYRMPPPKPLRAQGEGPSLQGVSFEPAMNRSSIPNPEIDPSELNKALTGTYFRVQDAYGAGAGHEAGTTVLKNWLHPATETLKGLDPTGRVGASKQSEHEMLNLLGALSRRSYQQGQGVPIKLYEFLGGLRGELSPILLGAGMRPAAEGWAGKQLVKTATGQNAVGQLPASEALRAAILAYLQDQQK